MLRTTDNSLLSHTLFLSAYRFILLSQLYTVNNNINFADMTLFILLILTLSYLVFLWRFILPSLLYTLNNNICFAGLILIVLLILTKLYPVFLRKFILPSLLYAGKNNKYLSGLILGILLILTLSYLVFCVGSFCPPCCTVCCEHQLVYSNTGEYVDILSIFYLVISV